MVKGVRTPLHKSVSQNIKGSNGRKQEKGKHKPVVKIRLLNVNGFDEGKYLDLARGYLCEEVYKDKKEYNLLCLTETKEKVESISMGEGVFFFSKMRGDDEKKGGGTKNIR